MTAACEKVIAIFDSTKWHRSALLSFLPAGRLDAIVTDVGAPEDVVQAWRSRGVEVTTADPERAAAPRAAPGLRPETDGAGSPSEGRMTTMAAVDLGAQSGRVAVGTLDGDRPPSPRCTVSRTSR